MKKQIDEQGFKDYRKVLIDRVEELDPKREDNLAIAFSGGTDSLNILFAFLATGRKPHCYTFRLDNYKSEDFLSAQTVCKFFDVPFTEVQIPTTKKDVVESIELVIPFCDVIKKTNIQCMIPFLYTYAALEEKKIIIGFKSDWWYLMGGRQTSVDLRTYGEEKMLELRKEFLSLVGEWQYGTSGGNIMDFAIAFEKEMIDFYDTLPIAQEFLKYEVKALHTPKEKYLSVGAFMDFYKQGAFYRKSSSYQINAKLDELHDLLLDPKSGYNKRGNKKIIGVYNDMAKDLELRLFPEDVKKREEEAKKAKSDEKAKKKKAKK